MGAEEPLQGPAVHELEGEGDGAVAQEGLVARDDVGVGGEVHRP